MYIDQFEMYATSTQKHKYNGSCIVAQIWSVTFMLSTTSDGLRSSGSCVTSVSEVMLVSVTREILEFSTVDCSAKYPLLALGFRVPIFDQ